MKSLSHRVCGATALAVALAPLAAPTYGTVPSGDAAVAPPAAPPHRINLPDGWQPEGVTTDGSFLYVGSLANGAIWRANPRTGKGRVLARGKQGRVAAGVDYDRRRDLLWVVGGATGTLRTHDADTGRLLATYRFPAPKPDTPRFLNDVVVTRHAVYGTDSVYQQLVGVPLRAGRQLPGPRAAFTRRLTGALHYTPGFNLNGIVRSGRALIAVQSNTGRLFRIHPRSGDTDPVRLRGGATVVNGDGLERRGQFLYVVRNQNERVAVVHLGRRERFGRVVSSLTSPGLDIPSTAALVRRSLWVVNARFSTTPTPSTPYWLTRLPARR